MKQTNNDNNNKLYAIFPILLVILAGVAYARVPSFREFVDAKAPWFREKAGHYLVAGASGGDQQAAGGDAAPGREAFDLSTFSAHPESWPRSIAIKAVTEFPAVVNGKVVGSVRAPAGSEVHLVKIENGKLGVEYRGGGAWMAPEATDLSERVQSTFASHPPGS
jgi:hypothetical protein